MHPESRIKSLSKASMKQRDDIFNQLTLSAKNVVYKECLLEYISTYHIKDT